jgi:hypothetical protein
VSSPFQTGPAAPPVTRNSCERQPLTSSRTIRHAFVWRRGSLLRRIPNHMARNPAKRRASKTTSNKPLDKHSKRGRGRPVGVDHALIVDRANWMEENLSRAWITLGPALLAAATTADVGAALEREHIGSIVSPGLFPQVLELLRDPDFPTTSPTAQARFLAESLAGWHETSIGVFVLRSKPRRARDICAEARAKAQPTHILRYEFYVECSCGYEGPSHDWRCPTCGARVPVPWWF